MGGVAQLALPRRVLAEIIASAVSLSVTFKDAIDGVIQKNPQSVSAMDVTKATGLARCQPIFTGLE